VPLILTYINIIIIIQVALITRHICFRLLLSMQEGVCCSVSPR